ncbi:MAG: MBL fold metallo-hydrolase [Candidatus Binataceae bacterium]
MREALTATDGLTITILGTGDAFASHGRFQSGYVIEGGGKRLLMECGPTTLCALKRADIQPASLDAILISHLHGDHFGGLPFLILEYLWESPRRTTLTIAGPHHLEERTWRLFHTMFPGFKPELERLKNKLKFVVLEPGDKRRLAGATVTTMRTPHMKPDVSLALRLELAGKTVTFTGDSGWTEELISFSAGADLFLCECTYFESTQLGFHLNYPLLAENRTRFDVGRMVLTHIGREVLERNGEVGIEMASDGMKIVV